MKNRIEILAELTRGCNRLADIACDHAKISINAVKNGCVNSSIASDVAQGPLGNAITTVRQNNLVDKITCVKADGLDAVDENVDVIVIAGLGGSVITSILEAGVSKLKNIKRLVLQANVAQENVRQFVINNNFKIVNELIIKDEGIVYEILVAEPGHQELTAKEIAFGPILLRDKPKLFIEQLESTLVHFERLTKQIPADKQSWLLEKSNMIKEILNDK